MHLDRPALRAMAHAFREGLVHLGIPCRHQTATGLVARGLGFDTPNAAAAAARQGAEVDLPTLDASLRVLEQGMADAGLHEDTDRIRIGADHAWRMATATLPPEAAGDRLLPPSTRRMLYRAITPLVQNRTPHPDIFRILERSLEGSRDPEAALLVGAISDLKATVRPDRPMTPCMKSMIPPVERLVLEASEAAGRLDVGFIHAACLPGITIETPAQASTLLMFLVWTLVKSGVPIAFQLSVVAALRLDGMGGNAGEVGRIARGALPAVVAGQNFPSAVRDLMPLSEWIEFGPLAYVDSFDAALTPVVKRMWHRAFGTGLGL